MTPPPGVAGGPAATARRRPLWPARPSRTPASPTSRPNRRLRGLGLAVDFTASTGAGRTWYFDVAGPNSAYRGGMVRSEIVWRALGRAHVLAARGVAPFVVLTTQLPRSGTESDRAPARAGAGRDLRRRGPPRRPDAPARLAAYADRPVRRRRSPGFWAQADVAPGAV